MIPSTGVLEQVHRAPSHVLLIMVLLICLILGHGRSTYQAKTSNRPALGV